MDAESSAVAAQEMFMLDRHRLLTLALQGLDAERTRIDAEIAGITDQHNGVRPQPRGKAGGQGRKRTISAAARKEISEAMKRSHAVRKKLAGKTK